MGSASASPADPAVPARELSSRRTERRPSAPEPDGHRSEALGSEVHVIVVDDDEDTRDILTLLLGAEGYRVHAVASGREAMDLMASMPEPPQLALVDIVMPGMSGLDVIREMRRTPHLAGVPVAVVSGLPQQRANAADIAAWLMKPPSVGLLLSTVARLTHR
jgi:CheY-like chemotaxis protein